MNAGESLKKEGNKDEKEIAPYAKEAVAALSQGYVIYGGGNNGDGLHFYPQKNATRAEAMTMVNRFYFNYAK